MAVKAATCLKNKTKEHEAGEWEVGEENCLYKTLVRKCRYCKKVMSEQIIK